MRSLWLILCIKWQDRVTNTQVLEETGMLIIHLQLCKYRFCWLGHVRTMKDGGIPKDLLYGERKEGRRKVGCPKLLFHGRSKERPYMHRNRPHHLGKRSRRLQQLKITCQRRRVKWTGGTQWNWNVKEGKLVNLMFMSRTHCLTAFDTHRNLYLHLRNKTQQPDRLELKTLTTQRINHCLSRQKGALTNLKG